MPREISNVTLGTGTVLSYAEQGDRSGPTLVLLPGPTDSWRSYLSVVDRIPLSMRTIAVSPRGHGDSDKPPTGYRVDDFAGDVEALFDALRIGRAVVAGHSGSCLVARRVAIDLPERVAGLVLEASPTTLYGNAGLTALVESTVSGLDDPIDPDFAHAFVGDTSSGGVAPEVLDAMAREVLKVPARVWQEMFAGLLQYDDRPELGRITAPTLLIWGDADEVVGREMQDELLARMSGAELVVYQGVGHTPRWEDPARFAADVTAFVERMGN